MATSKLILDIIARDQASGKFAALTAKASTLNRSMMSLGKSASQLGDKMTLGLSLPLAAVGAYAVKTQADFEQTMNVMQKASGASAVQMERLSDLAKQLGADTTFSAGEAAEAMLELAKGGLKPAQIEAGALEAAMTLAATEGMALAEAGTTMVNAMSVFNIEGSKSVKVADALAGASNASTASVASLAQALRQVGPGAANAGLSLNDTVGTLAAFDAAGIKGSDAGTSLKTMLARLVPNSIKAAEAFKKYNLELTDSEGNFKSVDEIAGILDKTFSDLSQKQRTLAFNTLFGSDATRAATVLMNEGEEGIRKYIEATEKNGAAQEMAGARMKGTAGAIEQMRGSVETAALVIGEALAPTVVDLTDKIKGAADWFANLDEGTQKNIVKMGLLVAAVGPALSIFGRLTTAIGASQAMLGTLGAKLTAVSAARTGAMAATVGRMGAMATFMSGPWGLAIAGAVTAVGLLAMSHKKATAKIGDYTDALYENEGALDKAMRATMAKELAESGELEMAANLGISTDLYTKAILGNKKAQDQVATALQTHIDQNTELVTSMGGKGGSVEVMNNVGREAQNLRDQMYLNADAFAEDRRQADLAASAMNNYADAMQRAVDLGARLTAVSNPGPGGGNADAARAAGGPVYAANGRYVVGEHGPEMLIMGRSGGRVVPHSRSLRGLGGGGGGITMIFNAPQDPVSVGREVRKALLSVKRAEGGRALGLA